MLKHGLLPGREGKKEGKPASPPETEGGGSNGQRVGYTILGETARPEGLNVCLCTVDSLSPNEILPSTNGY